MAALKWIFMFWLVPAVALAEDVATTTLEVGKEFAAADTLKCDGETNDDAKECLANLSWHNAKFTVQLQAAQPGSGDYLVRFPSPRPLGNEQIDMVAMEWFAAHDASKAICRAPAIVVVHESGRSMTVGRMVARSLGAQGLHAFLINLPGYGPRRVEELKTVERLLPALQQGIADVRRARDAVVALPMVDGSIVGLQGTSLGGFVAATVAGLDDGYDRVFILLAGGNLKDVVLQGSEDAAKTRKKLLDAGVTEEQIIEFARHVEPLRLAHRIQAEKTWLYSGKYDNVVPRQCSLALAKAAALPEGHHIEMPCDHYSGILHLPQVMKEIRDRMVNPPEGLQPGQ
jgi:dienelactone hydrolase